MKKLIICILIFAVSLDLIIFNAAASTTSVQDFESFSLGTDFLAGGNGSIPAERGHATVTVENTTKDSSTTKAVKVTYTGPGTDNWVSLTVTNIAHDWTGAEVLQLWVDMSAFTPNLYGGTGLYINFTDGADKVFAPPSIFSWTDGAGTGYNEQYGAVWTSDGGFKTGIINIPLSSFESSGAVPDLTNVKSIGIGFSAAPEVAGLSFYVDDINTTTLPASSSSESAITATKTVAQDFESVDVATDLLVAPNGSIPADRGHATVTVENTAKDSGTTRAAKLTYTGAGSDTWVNTSLLNIGHDWTGAETLQLWVDMSAFTPNSWNGTGLYISFVDGADKTFAPPSEFSWTDSAGAAHSELYGGIWTSDAGFKTGLINIPISTFESSGAVPDLSNVKSISIAFSGSEGVEGKSFYYDDINLYTAGTIPTSSEPSSESSSESSSSTSSTPDPYVYPDHTSTYVDNPIADFDQYTEGQDLMVDPYGGRWTGGGYITINAVTIEEKSEKGMKITYTDEGDRYNAAYLKDLSRDWTGAEYITFWIDTTNFIGAPYGGAGIYFGFTDANNKIFQPKSAGDANASFDKIFHYKIEIDGVMVPQSSGYGGIWLADSTPFKGKVELPISEFRVNGVPTSTTVPDLSDIKSIQFGFSGGDGVTGESFYVTDLSVFAPQFAASSSVSESSSSESASPDESNTTSIIDAPETGDSSLPIPLFALAAFVLAGMVLYRKRAL